MTKIISKVVVKEEMKNGASLTFNTITGRTAIEDKDGKEIGAVRFDTYIKLTQEYKDSLAKRNTGSCYIEKYQLKIEDRSEHIERTKRTIEIARKRRGY